MGVGQGYDRKQEGHALEWCREPCSEGGGYGFEVAREFRLAAAVVKAKTVWVSQNAEEPIDVAKAVAEWKVQEVNEAAELKVEQARRPI